MKTKKENKILKKPFLAILVLTSAFTTRLKGFSPKAWLKDFG